jgi:hypothetical protein
MSNGQLVPATACSRYIPAWQRSLLVIGDQTSNPPNPNPDAAFSWQTAVDLTNLNIVTTDVSDGTTVPADIAKYTGNAQYYLYAIGNCLDSGNVPQGVLYTLLQSIGAGPGLAQTRRKCAYLERLHHRRPPLPAGRRQSAS